MSKTSAKPVEPSIDDMLTSIREAIHEETAREAEEHARTFKIKKQADRTPSLAPPEVSRSRPSGVSGSMRGLRVSLQPSTGTEERGTVTARSEDFLSLKNKLASLRSAPPPREDAPRGAMAGIMGGDVRLEDALARLNTAEQLQRRNAPPPPEPPAPRAAEPKVSEPVIRQAIEEPPTSEVEFGEPDVIEVVETQPEIAEVPCEPEVPPPPPPAEPVPQVAEEPAAALAETAPVEAPEPVRTVSLPEPRPMMSVDAAAAASSAFERLTEELFARSPEGNKVLEDSARDMIRPMLKKWLDDNLPDLVERLVKEEIERVARRGGR